MRVMFIDFPFSTMTGHFITGALWASAIGLAIYGIWDWHQSKKAEQPNPLVRPDEADHLE